LVPPAMTGPFYFSCSLPEGSLFSRFSLRPFFALILPCPTVTMVRPPNVSTALRIGLTRRSLLLGYRLMGDPPPRLAFWLSCGVPVFVHHRLFLEVPLSCFFESTPPLNLPPHRTTFSSPFSALFVFNTPISLVVCCFSTFHDGSPLPSRTFSCGVSFHESTPLSTIALAIVLRTRCCCFSPLPRLYWFFSFPPSVALVGCGFFASF